MANNIDIFSAAAGLSDGFATGGGSNPSTPSIHPDINVCGEGNLYSDAAVGNKPAEDYGLMGPTAGSTPGVSLAEGAPEGYSDADLGMTLVGGLGDPPRP